MMRYYYFAVMERPLATQELLKQSLWREEVIAASLGLRVFGLGITTYYTAEIFVVIAALAWAVQIFLQVFVKTLVYFFYCRK